MRLLPSRQPGLRIPRHQGTTRHMSAIYPWHANEGLGMSGVYIGEDTATGSAWCYDPFQLYADKVISSPNILIVGQIGSGKSTAVKTLVSRSVGMLGNGYGGSRWCAIVDPKGEYGPMAQIMDLRQVHLYPGGKTRLNPLDGGPMVTSFTDLAVRRTDTMAALTSALVRRDLSPTEEASLSLAIRAMTKVEQEHGAEVPTIETLIRLLATPTAEMVADLGVADAQAFVGVAMDMRHGLESLTKGRLAGMFDGESTEAPNWDRNGVVIDVSSVFGDDRAFELVMIAVTGWLQSLMATPEGPDVPRRMQVLEEIWALLGSKRVASYYQSSQKLARAYGVCNIAVAHRLSDLRAQSDDGTAEAKMGTGILADTETRIMFRQPTDQIAEATEMLGLTPSQARTLPTLAKGVALWQVGNMTAEIRHRVATPEKAMVWTDGALAT